MESGIGLPALTTLLAHFLSRPFGTRHRAAADPALKRRAILIRSLRDVWFDRGRRGNPPYQARPLCKTTTNNCQSSGGATSRLPAAPPQPASVRGRVASFSILKGLHHSAQRLPSPRGYPGSTVHQISNNSEGVASHRMTIARRAIHRQGAQGWNSFRVHHSPLRDPRVARSSQPWAE